MRSAIPVWIGAAMLSAAFSACSLFGRSQPPVVPIQPPPPPAPTNSIVGIASWYGPGFNGRPTASGQIYDQEDLTAASDELPLGSRAMVTNLDNGRSVEVTINDRGPFVKGRKIDLSDKAAQVLGMIGPGTAPVRIDAISAAPGSRPIDAAPGYFVQVGSFSLASNAHRMARQLSRYWTDVSVDRVETGRRFFYRVRMGSFATRCEADHRAREATLLGYPIIIVRN